MERFPFSTVDSELSEKPRVQSAKFGDGYGQDSPDGLNSTLQVWTLTFKEVYSGQVTQIRDFLKARKGVERFEFVTPLGDLITVKCQSEWKITPAKKGLLNMTNVVLEQVP